MAASLYAPIARAIYDGVKRGNSEALVAIGETSPRGHDAPSRGSVQDSHSPARFARLLSEERPAVPFDAWAQHPYPPRASVAPDAHVRWPRVGLGNLERFGESIDAWFGRDQTPLWVTEYAHETRPGNPVGVEPELQATFAAEALEIAAQNPRVRLFVWFTLRDSPANPWASGLLAEDDTPKPAFASFRERARALDGRNPVLPPDAVLARIPVLELARYTPGGRARRGAARGARALLRSTFGATAGWTCRSETDRTATVEVRSESTPTAIRSTGQSQLRELLDGAELTESRITMRDVTALLTFALDRQRR